VTQLFSAAFTVAMLGAIESLMSAVVSDRMSNDKHNPNMELIGQGIANIVSPAFRRAACHRSDRAHGNQRAFRRQDPIAE